jgi:lysozyme
MSVPYRVSPEGLALVQRFEGLQTVPQALDDGRWLIGYGHVTPVQPGPITAAAASELLARDLAEVTETITRDVQVPLNQAQVDALSAFVFSIGAAAFARSEMLVRLNAGEYAAAAAAMQAWRKGVVGGEVQVLEALVRRRTAEAALFLSGDGSGGVPSARLAPSLDHAAAILGAPGRMVGLEETAPVEAAPVSAPAPIVPPTPVPLPKASAAKADDGAGTDPLAAKLRTILAADPATRPALLPVAPIKSQSLAVLDLTEVVDEPEAPARGKSWLASADAVAFGSLVVFGLALCAVGLLSLIGRGPGGGDPLGFAAFFAPGTLAVAAGAYYLWKGNTPRDPNGPWPLSA